MKRLFRKASALIAVLLLGAPARSQNSLNCNDQDMKSVMDNISNLIHAEGNLESRVIIRRADLDRALQTPISDEKYLEVQKLIEQMKDSGVVIQEVTPDEMVLSTQEYAL